MSVQRDIGLMLRPDRAGHICCSPTVMRSRRQWTCRRRSPVRLACQVLGKGSLTVVSSGPASAPVSEVVRKRALFSRMSSDTCLMSVISCTASGPAVPTTIRCGECFRMKSRTRAASLLCVRSGKIRVRVRVRVSHGFTIGDQSKNA